jgi:hypothetical protein
MNDSFFVRVASVSVLVLLFLSQFLPTAYVELKAVFLLTAIVCVLAAMLTGRLFLQHWQVCGLAVLVTTALLFSAYGVVRGNPGASRVLSVWLLWPLVYLFFTSLMQQANSYAWLSRVFVISLWAVTLYGYLYLGNASGIVPDYLYIELDQGQNVGFYEGFVEFRLYSISSLIFLVPFYLHLVLEKHKRKSNQFAVLTLLTLLAAVLLAIMTGRRALLLVLLLLPFTILFSNRFLGNELKLKTNFPAIFLLSLLCLGIFGIGMMFDLRSEAIYDMFLEGFDFSSQHSASERAIQFYSLIDGWLESSIFFGAGNGAAASILRSDEFPWAYELTYVYLIFSTGIVGLLIYFGWFGYGLFKLREAIKSRPDLIIHVAPMLTASLSFCIAAATNPYFGKFDYLWIVLLPFFLAGWTKYQSLVKEK